MIGLLARVVIGVVVGGAAYGVYKCITKDSVKSEINEKIAGENIYQDAFKAMVKQKENDSIKFDVLDMWDEPLGQIDLYGDEISNDIKVGDEIMLKESY